MTARKGLSLIEVIVVLAILAVLLALTLPAILFSREKAREVVCRNNLHNLNLAVAQFYEARRELPHPAPPGEVGGWVIDILPFIGHGSLRETIPPGLKIEDTNPGAMVAQRQAGLPRPCHSRRESRRDAVPGALCAGRWSRP